MKPLGVLNSWKYFYETKEAVEFTQSQQNIFFHTNEVFETVRRFYKFSTHFFAREFLSPRYFRELKTRNGLIYIKK